MLEQQWQENIHTTEGRLIHERVHSGLKESRSDTIIFRSVDIVSYKLGLVGKSDCIELKKDEKGCTLPFQEGRWVIYPVEYKHGPTRNEYEYELQICCQAMCLEEMLNCSIGYGFIFYEGDHNRLLVEFDESKRLRVKKIATELHRMQRDLITPEPVKSKRCKECSMKDVCLPGKLKNPTLYIKSMFEEAGGKKP